MNNTTYEGMMHAYTAEEWAEFAFFAANVQHVLDEQDTRKHLHLYQQYLAYSERQASMDMLTAAAKTCSPSLKRSLAQGAMLVSFHFGQYRSIPLSLLAMGYKVCILVTRDVLDAQVEHYRRHLPAGYFANLLFVVSEDPRLFFQLRRCRSEGYIILCYADGGSGVQPQGQRSSEGTQRVQLGHAQVEARSGFAAMAYLLNLPVSIILAPTGIRPDGWTLGVNTILLARQTLSREAYTREVVECCYAKLSRALANHPACWECWSDMRQLLPLQIRPLTWNPANRYLPFEKNEKPFLLDKASYAIHPLDRDWFVQMKKAII